jgi:hypothetical protein
VINCPIAARAIVCAHPFVPHYWRLAVFPRSLEIRNGLGRHSQLPHGRHQKLVMCYRIIACQLLRAGRQSGAQQEDDYYHIRNPSPDSDLIYMRRCGVAICPLIRGVTADEGTVRCCEELNNFSSPRDDYWWGRQRLETVDFAVH